MPVFLSLNFIRLLRVVITQACSSLSRQEFESKFQKSWKTFERMWVRTLKIEVLFTFTISPMFEKFTRNQVSHLKWPDLSRSRQCFFPIASRFFYDGVDDDDDDDDDDDADDVTSGSGHSLDRCFCVYQNFYCDCAVDDQFYVLRYGLPWCLNLPSLWRKARLSSCSLPALSLFGEICSSLFLSRECRHFRLFSRSLLNAMGA